VTDEPTVGALESLPTRVVRLEKENAELRAKVGRLNAEIARKDATLRETAMELIKLADVVEKHF
jgi:hypothetical protein